MKFVFFLGGLIGFVVAAGAGLSAGRTADHVLLDAAIGCLVGALLFRWFWSVLLRGLRETYIARQRAAAAAATANTAAVTAGAPAAAKPRR